jgi:hypothetical protein
MCNMRRRDATLSVVVRCEPSPGADVGGAGQVPVQMWEGWAEEGREMQKGADVRARGGGGEEGGEGGGYSESSANSADHLRVPSSFALEGRLSGFHLQGPAPH